jgi:NADPH:quinone reductase-like Zn-dependent oxidoreductase
MHMKAIVLTRYGGPDVLELQEVEKPEPRPGEVLVRVHATAVNDWDWCLMRGEPRIYRLMYGLFRPKVKVLGAEVAGTVEAVGEGVTAFRAGDRVYGDLSEAGFGAFAEYVAVPVRALATMPARMSFEEAAALPHAGMLALQGLVDVGAIQKGDKVLINGAGGGVGTLGIQIAKQFGAEVTGVDAAAKLDALRSLGFDQVIDFRARDFTDDGPRYDLILDAKTTRSPGRYLRALTPRGRYVTVGGPPSRLLQCLFSGPAISMFSDKRVRIVALKPNKGLAYVNELFERGGLRVLVDGPYPLHEVPRALQHFGAAEHVGKVVISVISTGT